MQLQDRAVATFEATEETLAVCPSDDNIISTSWILHMTVTITLP